MGTISTPASEPGSVELEVEVPGVLTGLVLALDAQVSASAPWLDEALGALAELNPDRPVKSAVRDLLRHGKYKPTGRGKPASEYLVRAHSEGRFPRINNLVDAINLVSLSSGLPISLIDVDRAGSQKLAVRRGKPDESFVFNAGGQTIDLQDLLLIATRPSDEPIANPVKDSMRSKLVEDSTRVLAVLYAPEALRSTLVEATESLRRLFEAHARATDVTARLAPP